MPTLGDSAQTDPVDLSEPAGRPTQSGCESPLRPAASLNLNAQCGGFPAERTLALGCTSFIQAMPSSLSAAVRVGRSPRVKLPTWRFASLPHRTHKLMDQRNLNRGGDNLRFAERSTRFLPKRGKTASGSFSGRLELSSPPSRARERALPAIARAPSPQLPKHKKPQVPSRGPPAAPGPGPGDWTACKVLLWWVAAAAANCCATRGIVVRSWYALPPGACTADSPRLELGVR